jgi:hypothetical protein
VYLGWNSPKQFLPWSKLGLFGRELVCPFLELLFCDCLAFPRTRRHVAHFSHRSFDVPILFSAGAQTNRREHYTSLGVKENKPRVFIYVVLLFVIQVITSGAFHILKDYWMLVYSVYVIFGMRQYAASQGRQGDESKLGFGQILPLLLLALPLSQLAEELLSKTYLLLFEGVKANSVVANK